MNFLILLFSTYHVVCKDYPVVYAPVGKIIGLWKTSVNHKTYRTFRGLKYGHVKRRFQPADGINHYRMKYLALADGPVCPQADTIHPIQEDCLYLNIYAPEHASNLPVIFWIHGGSFTSGSARSDQKDPEYIVERGVIVVAINYRLGPFGFLSLENKACPGNMGFRDQNLALKWIIRNIQSFGGDPKSITLFGQSAGSFSVMYQMVSPLSHHLFQRCIAQSSAPFEPLFQSNPKGKALNITLALAKSFNCDISTHTNILKCLESKTMKEILHAQYLCENDNICSYSPWDAVVDSYLEKPFLPDTPENLVKKGLYNKVPCIVGVNSEEGLFSAKRYINNPTLFPELNEYWIMSGPLYMFGTSVVTKQQLETVFTVRHFYLKEKPASINNIHDVIDMFSDMQFWSGVHRFSMLGYKNSPIFKYFLSYRSKHSFSEVSPKDSLKYNLTVAHGDDLIYLFKNILQKNAIISKKDVIMRNKFVTWWTNFAKTGSPTKDGSWKSFDLRDPAYYELNINPKITCSERYQERMEFWMKIIDELKQTEDQAK